MYQSKKRFFALLLTLFFTINALCCFSAAAEKESIGEKIELFVSENKATTAGMAVAVFDTETVIYNNYFGYSDLSNQIPVDQDTVFDWGSSAKSFVWISLMQLWEKGLLSLDTDIRTYLPENFLSNLKYEKPITIINLMNHDAGFEEMISDGMLMNPESIPSLHDQLQLHMPDQVFEPGLVVAYSNWGTALAGYIVECVSGKNFADYVWENILHPLGMKDIAILADMSDNPQIKQRRDALHCYNTDCSYRGVCNYSVMIAPAGMCCSTLKEFMTFAQALLAREEGILFENEATWDEFYSATSYFPETNIPRNCHGLWVTEFSVQTVGHSGNSQGCSSVFYLDLENRQGMTIMTNQFEEQIYNSDMPELLFGSFLDSSLYNPDTPLAEGSYRLARTFWDGPFSIYYDTYHDMQSDPNAGKQVWTVSEKNGITILSYNDTDLVLLSEAHITASTIILFLVVIALIYAFCVCFFGGCILRPIKNYIRKKKGLPKPNGVLSALHYSSCILIGLWGVNTGAIAYLLLNNASSAIYFWLIVLHGVFGLGMIALTLLIIFLMFTKVKCSVSQKIRYLSTCAAQIVIIIALIRWDMYQFWAF